MAGHERGQTGAATSNDAENWFEMSIGVRDRSSIHRSPPPTGHFIWKCRGEKWRANSHAGRMRGRTSLVITVKVATPLPGGPADNSNTAAPNRRDDVMLVQYLLRGIPRKKSPQAWRGWRWTASSVRSLRVPSTSSKSTCGTAGCRSRWTGGWIAPAGRSASFTIYTIIWLNVKFGEANPTVDFAKLQSDPAMPAQLRAAIGPPRAVTAVTG
jgi:hypothetical protein